MFDPEGNRTLVFDIGSRSMRFGFATNISQKFEIPASVGVYTGNQGEVSTKVCYFNPEEYDILDRPKGQGPSIVRDTTGIECSKTGIEIDSYMNNGMIGEWDIFEKMVRYTYREHIRSNPKDHPVLMTEPPWIENKIREKLTELMFEKFDVPGFFLAKNSVLVALAHGCTTGLVVDSGAVHTTTTVIRDGFVIKDSIRSTKLAGDYISLLCQQQIKKKKVDIVPNYMIKRNETEMGIRCSIRSNFVPPVTASWHNYNVEKLIHDFKKSVLEISEIPYIENSSSEIPPVHYEFPHGRNENFASDGYLIGEVMFNPNILPIQDGPTGNVLLGTGNIARESINMFDSDVIPSLYQNVIVTGGNSCIRGFPLRLQYELKNSKLPVRIVYCGSDEDRQFGSWIGGCIFASRDDFTSSLITKKEYLDYGRSLVRWKCF